VHGEHGLVEGFELAGFFFGDAVLRGGEVKVAFGVVDAFAYEKQMSAFCTSHEAI
jgi:hypothetical protein